MEKKRKRKSFHLNLIYFLQKLKKNKHKIEQKKNFKKHSFFF